MVDGGELLGRAGLELLAALGDGVLGLDSRGRCIYANAPMASMLRAPVESLLGLGVGEALGRTTRLSLPAWEECLERLAAGASSLSAEQETLTRRDGTSFPAQLLLYPLAVGEGLAGVAVVVRDLSARNLQAKAFNASVRSFRALFDGMSDALLFASPGGEILDANHGVQRMLGFVSTSLVGRSLAELATAQERALDALPEQLSRLREDLALHIEFQARASKGRSFAAEMYLYPTSYFGQPAVLAMIHDITARKRHEAELLASRNAAEESSRLKSRVMANMSHELRTPMGAILGMGELLLSLDLPEEQQGYARSIVDSGRQLLGIINDILDFTRLDAPDHEPRRDDFSLAMLVEEQVRKWGQRCASRGLAMDAHCDPALPEWVVGDMEAVRKLLSHLLDNAVKFTRQGGVRLAVTRLEEEPGAGVRVRFAVADSGVGIAPEQLETIFEPFVQGDASSSRQFGGIGLGLALARAQARRLGGDIQVRSTQGQGSEFSLTLAFGVSDL